MTEILHDPEILEAMKDDEYFLVTQNRIDASYEDFLGMLHHYYDDAFPDLMTSERCVRLLRRWRDHHTQPRE